MTNIRSLMVTIFLCMFSVLSYAAQINETGALEKAQQFYSQKKTSILRSAPDFQLIYACKDSSTLLRAADENAPVYFYIFNLGKDQGFIVVSGDDATKSILGYSDEGSFSVENMPENLQNWLDFYKKEIKFSLENGWSSTVIDSASTTTLRSANVVNPLLGNVKWNQNAPYNDLCPLYPNTKERTMTGCIATAMAQIMKYHQWPVSGTGSNSYSTTLYGTLSADFSKKSYDWNAMLESYGNTSTPAQDTAVATIMYHCGIATNMSYNTAGNGGSGAYDGDAAKAFSKYFGYDSDVQLYLRKYFSSSEWVDMLKSELNAANPVLYMGNAEDPVTKNISGHAFVCDGYDSNNLFHINWGWGGTSNGYFELSSLNPYATNIGAGYSQEQDFIGGIHKPDLIDQKVYMLGLYDKGLTSSETTLTSVAKTFSLDFGFYNSGIIDYNGEIGIALYQNGVLIQLLGSRTPKTISYSRGYLSYPFSNVTLPALQAGSYQIYTVFRPNVANASWSLIRNTSALNNYVNVYVSNDKSITFQKPVTSPILTHTQAIQTIGSFYQNKTASFSITLNNAGSEFNSNLAVYLYSTTNPLVSQYINNGVVCVPAGESKTFTISGKITCAPGSYYAVAVYDSTNAFSTSKYKQFGPSSYGQIPITIQNEPSVAVLSLTGEISFTNATINKNETLTLNANMTNTGGLYASYIMAYIFPTTGGNSIAYFDPKTISIDTNENKTFSLTGSLNLDPGDYMVALYYYNLGTWIQFQPEASSYLIFHLTNQVSALDNEKAANFSIYPNPVKDLLNIQTDESIKRAQVTDLSGRMILNMSESNVLSLGHLKQGIYILRVETESGIKTERFIKD